ncbi:hypothetical protein [Dokdonella sp.]|uniref:hypothetical protein n=1 Tax=Dokdonella sp. TaxID=2291710 RepID=UPI0037846935
MLLIARERRHSQMGMDNPSPVRRSRPMSSAYDRILLTLYSRVAEADWATDLLGEITRATRSRSAAIVAVDLTRGRDSLPAFVGAEAASAVAYESRYAAHNPWRPPPGEAQGPGKLRVSDDVLSLSELKRTVFWDDFLRPMDVAHGVGLVGLHDRAHVASLTLLRDERRGPYRGAELALLGRLAPHWVVACQLRERLGLLTDAERGLVDVLDGWPRRCCCSTKTACSFERTQRPMLYSPEKIGSPSAAGGPPRSTAKAPCSSLKRSTPQRTVLLFTRWRWQCA